jgi:hypothetical protein
MKRLLLTGSLVAALSVGASVTAADASTGRDYGHHVAACAQTMGFIGSHNPGMHHGIAGWDGAACEN